MNAQQLKNAILQEAIEGRLVPQDPNEEPASVLLARIRKEKERLVKEGKLKKKDLIEIPISEDEIPFEIPESWEWCSLGSVISLLSGRDLTPQDYNDNNDGIPYITGASNFEGGSLVINRWTPKPVSISKYGDLLITCKGTIGTMAFNTVGDIHIARQVMAISPYIIDLNFIKFYLMRIVSELDKKAKSIIPGISREDILTASFPLPPLAEQKRIVAKIEELLPKVEEYGKAQEALDKLNEELPERLKKSILQEAIEGRLVPQDPNDEPASVLLAKIRKEKEQLVKEGKLKKKDLIETPITDDEIPFEIPESWEWCRLGNIGLFERGSGIKRDETFESGYPCVRYGEMYTKYKYAPTFGKTVSFTSKSVFEKCRKAHKGDLFMALTGENKQDISLAAQYVGDEEVAVGGDLCHLTTLEVYGLYFVYLINSTYFSNKKEILATGDIIVHISTDKLASIPIPLPPLAEQHRIVEKLEQVLGEIDKLKV